MHTLSLVSLLIRTLIESDQDPTLVTLITFQRTSDIIGCEGFNICIKKESQTLIAQQTPNLGFCVIEGGFFLFDF